MTDGEITPKVLLVHMQGMIQGLRTSLEQKMSGLDRKISSIEKTVVLLTHRMDRVEGDIALMKVQVGNIGDTVDRMEIILIGQKHEERIWALERRCSVRT